jgi:dTDP-4-amino-4,6-dideoxygalactose transaminase
MLKVNETILPDKNKLFDYFSQVYSNGQVTNNSLFVGKLEKLIANYTNSKFVIATSSGTMALHLALKSLGQNYGEIVTTPLSFIASTSSILWENFKPVFCDVDENTFCIDVDKVEKKINKKTVAILAVNLFGNTCDIERLEILSKQKNLTLIFDSAHSFGTTYKGKSCLLYGDISITSFHASKIFSTVEGGAIFMKNNHKFQEIFKMRYFGKDYNNMEVMLGTNGKMSEFHAAYGLASFENLSFELKRRKEIADFYTLYFEQNSDFFTLQKTNNHTLVNNSFFPLIIKNSNLDIDKLLLKALENGINFRRYFSPPLNELKFVNSIEQDTPIASAISKRIICIPIHSKLENNDLNKIINFLDSHFKNE